MIGRGHRRQFADRSADYVSRIVGLGPAGYWVLDESSGTTVADSSGNSRDGTRNSSVCTLSSDNLLDGGRSYAGTGQSYSAGAPVEVADNAAFRPGSGSFSLEIWFRISSGTSITLITKSKSGTAWPSVHFTASTTSGPDLQLRAANSSTVTKQITWNSPIVAGKTYHAVFVKNSGTDCFLCLNGEPRTYSDDTTTVWSDSSNPVGIGGNPTSISTTALTGRMAHAAWYGFALTRAQAIGNFEAGAAF